MGFNLHDNDLVPIDATPAERDHLVRSFKRVCQQAGLKAPMATVNLFYDPVFRDSAFTANDPGVRAQCRRTMRAMDIAAELEAKVFVPRGQARRCRDRRLPPPGRSYKPIP
jgi:xylose isomerase